MPTAPIQRAVVASSAAVVWALAGTSPGRQIAIAPTHQGLIIRGRF